MKLLFDIGNTSVNWALRDAQAFQTRGRFDYKDADLLSQLEQRLAVSSSPDDILVASVASDQQNRLLDDWLSERWQVKPWHATVGKECAGLTNSYADCRQMGIDRWLAMISAWSDYRTALCVVDSGTALTIDFIAANGQHAGGFILPGMALMQTELLKNTDRIKAEVGDRLSIERASNTQAAIAAGASLALVGAIERAFSDFQSTCSEQVQGVITGGNAHQLVGLLDGPFKLQDTLVLDGLLKLREATT